MAKTEKIESVKILAVNISEARMVDRDEQGRPIPGKELGTAMVVRYAFLNEEGKQVNVEGKGVLSMMEKMPKNVPPQQAEKLVAMSTKTKKALDALMAEIQASIEENEGI